jgi:hypothetical protein
VSVVLDLGNILLLVVPAWLLMRLLRPRPTLLEAVSETLLLTVVLVPIPVFTVALLARSYLTVAWMATGSAILTTILLALHLRRHRSQSGQLRGLLTSLKERAETASHTRAILAGALAVFCVFLVDYDRRHFEYGCINGVVMQALTPEAAGAFDPHGGKDEDAVDSTDFGAPAERGQAASMGLIDVHGTGQRLGTTAIIAPMVTLFEVFGFRLLFALLPTIGFLFGVRLIRTLTGRPRVALLMSLCAFLNPYVLKIVILDENVMAYCLSTASLALLLEPPGRPALTLAGIAFGAALGVRHIDLPFGLCALILMGTRPKAWLMFGVPALLAALPCALHHHYAYGSVFAHEHFVDEIFVSVPHSFLWWDFQYTGLLNYPFAETMIRTPYNPWPTWLYYPLNIVGHLGTALGAIAAIGVWQLVQRHRYLALALLAWAAPQYALLSVLENWMDPNKMGVIITLFPILVVTLGLGAAWIASWRQAGAAALATLALSGLMLLSPSWDFQDDPRFYAKYPRVRAELPEYLDHEQALVATGSPLPSSYFAQQYALFRPGERLARLWQDLQDRRFRRDSPTIADAGEATVSVTIDLSKPLIGSLDFATTSGGGVRVDATGAQTAVALTGLNAWESQPLDALVARNATHEVDVYLRFGEDGFADVTSDRVYSIEQRERPHTRQLPTNGAQEITLVLRAGDRLRLLETVSLDEVLVYVWELDVDSDGIALHKPRKMFHN